MSLHLIRFSEVFKGEEVSEVDWEEKSKEFSTLRGTQHLRGKESKERPARKRGQRDPEDRNPPTGSGGHARWCRAWPAWHNGTSTAGRVKRTRGTDR